MQINHLKAYIFKALKTSVIITSFLTSLSCLIYTLICTSQKSVQELDDSSKKLSKTLKEMQKSITEAQKAENIWKSGVNSRFAHRSGINLKQANIAFEKLKTTFKLKNVKINISNPVEKLYTVKSEYTKIMYSTGSIIFDANTDIDVFKFINTFIKQTPGFIQPRKLTITRPSGGAEKLIFDIESGQIQKIINVNMDFVWLDVQDVKNDEPPAQPDNSDTSSKELLIQTQKSAQQKNIEDKS